MYEGQLDGERAPNVALPQGEAEHSLLPRLQAQHLWPAAVPCKNKEGLTGYSAFCCHLAGYQVQYPIRPDIQRF